MPRTRSLAWAELKIGLVAIFAIVMATMLIFLLSGEGGFFWQQYPLKASFDNVAGLKPGAPVRLAGVEVGTVTDVVFQGERVDVHMDVNREMRDRITDDSVASLGAVSLLGEAAVDITASAQGTPIADWGYVRTGRAVGSISDVAAQATEGIERLTDLLGGIREGEGTIGRLFTDDALYTQMTSLVTAYENVARQITEGDGPAGRLLRDSASGAALSASLENLQAVTAGLRSGEGSLGRLLTEDTLADSLTATTNNLSSITGRISQGEGTAGKLITDSQLYDRLNAMTDRLDSVLRLLQTGEGTAGQLLRDRQLYENMNGAVTELHSLITDIRADPRRYLNVRVSIF